MQSNGAALAVAMMVVPVVCQVCEVTICDEKKTLTVFSGHPTVAEWLVSAY